MTENAPKVRKRIRRDYKKIVESTIQYCKIAIQLCEEFRAGAGATESELMEAQIRAYKRVLRALGEEAEK